MDITPDLNELEGIDWERINLKKRKCGNCNKCFDTEVDLRVHNPCFHKSGFYDATRSKPCQCPKCDFACGTVNHLTQHAHRHYQKTFQCLHCSIQMSRRDTLFSHLKTVHYKSRCIITNCKQEFQSKQQLKKHVLEIHTKSTTDCVTCGHVVLQTSLEAHVCRRKYNTNASHFSLIDE